MNSLHSLADNLLTAGMTYGWRIDALLVGGILWALMAGIEQAHPTRLWQRSALAIARA